MLYYSSLHDTDVVFRECKMIYSLTLVAREQLNTTLNYSSSWFTITATLVKDLNLKLSFFWTFSFTVAWETNQLYYLSIGVRVRDGFIPFLRALICSEILTTSSRIWTLLSPFSLMTITPHLPYVYIYFFSPVRNKKNGNNHF